MFMCQHCGRQAESESDRSESFTCNALIDRAEWAKLPIRAPAERMVGRNADGKEICIGTMYPIEDYPA
jgi:biotin synthase-related radical SAM superfamily protein